MPVNLPPGLRSALSCVCSPPAYESIAKTLFGSWLIADTYNQAVLFQTNDLHHKINCVTLSGVLLFASGEVRSCSSKYSLSSILLLL